jgi:hypothetical protein
MAIHLTEAAWLRKSLRAALSVAQTGSLRIADWQSAWPPVSAYWAHDENLENWGFVVFFVATLSSSIDTMVNEY